MGGRGGNATQPETLNGRLPLEHGSVRPQTLPKRVSDDPRRFIFRRQNILFSKFSQALDGRLPPEDASDLAETWPKRLSDDPQRFIFRSQTINVLQNVRKLWTAVYLPRMAWIGLKLGQNAFQTIADISFSPPPKYFRNFSE